jgi:hypothetical protein
MIAGMDPPYIELMNEVLAVNYFGEVLTVELISNLIKQNGYYRYHSLLTRQLLDETRHANITRKLLLDRGHDPLRDNRLTDFTFHDIFRDFMGRGGDAVLALLGENERISSGNFERLVRIAKTQGDDTLVSLYSEIVNDEVTHTKQIFRWLPKDDPAVEKAREEGRTRMQKSFNPKYLRLFSRYLNLNPRNQRAK